MLVKDCYLSFGGDYDEVLSRLRNDERIQKYIIKFLKDTSYQNLLNSMEIKDIDSAFLFAHTLKGTSQNLGFTNLSNSASAATELLRNKEVEGAIQILSQVRMDYQCTITAIQAFCEHLT